MNIPHGFIEASAFDATETLAIVIAAAEVACVKEASSYAGSVKALVVLKGGDVLQLATPFSSIVERLSVITEGDAE